MDRPKRLMVLDLDSLDVDWAMSHATEKRLPHLRALHDASVRVASTWPRAYIAENVNTAYLTGCLPQTTGFWTFYAYDPVLCRVDYTSHYDFSRHPIFYRYLAPGRVTSFDLPQVAPDPDSPGVQVTDWGTHGPRSASSSIPEYLHGKLVERFGASPLLAKDSLNLTNPKAMQDCYERFFVTLPRRAAITRHLMEETEWELFATTIAETHSALHNFWPAPNLDIPQYREEMLHELYAEIDRTIGEILRSLPEDSGLCVLSVEGMEANGSDLPSLVFLPELLYRHSFPGHQGMDFDRHEKMKENGAWKTCRYWKHHLLPVLRQPSAVGRLLRRYLAPEQAADWEMRLGMVPAPFPPGQVPHDYKPIMWYSPFWKHMKAFALPSFYSGLVRVNLAGRERHGIVPAAEFQSYCDELCAMLEALTRPDGTPAVREIIRTRPDDPADRPGLPQADLIIDWNPDNGNHLVSPEYGNLGPVCPTRPGAHHGRGFAWYVPPGGLERKDGGRDLDNPVSVVDFAPTILDLLGRTPPGHMDGRSFAGRLLEAAQAKP